MKKHHIEISTTMINTEEIQDLILKSATAVLDRHSIENPCFIDITITDNEEIRELNREYRDKDYATDVLSFPLCEWLDGEFLDDINLCLEPESDVLALGDMVISYDKIVSQAEEFGHSLEREFAYLTVHSTLHLIGYDHEDSDERKTKMRAMEDEILEKLGILR